MCNYKVLHTVTDELKNHYKNIFRKVNKKLKNIGNWGC